MALNPWQKAIEDLALSLGLQGQAQQQIYQMPQFDALIEQFFGPIQLPAGVSESQVTTRTGKYVEYKDAEGYIHRLERDIDGRSSTLGAVKETSTNRPPIPPPPNQPQNQQLTGNLLNTLLGTFGGQQGATGTAQPTMPSRNTVMSAPGRGGSMYQQGPNQIFPTQTTPQIPPRQTPGAPQLPDFSFLQGMLMNQPGAPQLPNFGQLSQMFGQIPSAPQMPNLSGIAPQINNAQFSDIISRLMQPAQLAQLQQGDLANLNAIKAATDAQLAQQFQAGQSNLISSLYGRNINQSTIANKSAADILQAQGMVQLQSDADAASRMLGLQQFLTQTGQGNLAIAGQTAAQQAQAANQAAQTQAQLALGGGQLALQGYATEQGLRQQQLQTLAQSLFQQGQLSLGAYGAQNDARLQGLGLLANSLFQQGQLGLSRYTAESGVESDRLGQTMQLLNMLSNLDLNRSIASGQLGLGQAELAERMRQFNSNLSWQQELQRIQERAARDAFTRSLWTMGLGAAGSLLTGGITGGLGSLFSGGGQATGWNTALGGSSWGTPPLTWGN